MMQPGTRLRSLAARLLNSSTMERLIDPAIADLQHEHDDAIRRGLPWRGRWIRLAGYFAFWKVAGIAAARHALHERTTADDRAVGRTVVFSLVAVIALTALLLWPFNTLRRSGTGMTLRLVLFLVPQALAVTLPLGLVFGILLGLRDRGSTTRVKWTITALAIGCSSAAFIIVGWLMPAANQAFRELAAGQRLLRGLNELTLGELASADPTRVMRLISGDVSARRLAWEFHFRVALAVAPLVLGLFSLGVTTARRKNYGRVAMGLTALAASFGYYVLLFNAHQAVLYSDWLPPMVTAWVPNFMFLMLALRLSRGRQTRRDQQAS